MSSAPDKVDAALPNVLLIGDSITRAYYPEVVKDLAGKANCYYFATSAGSGDERLPGQIAATFRMFHMKWAVVHFNNGMHGWGYTEEEYGRYLPEMLDAVKAGASEAGLIWATTTPVRKEQASGASNARIVARNTLAVKAIAGQGIAVDDQYGLMIAHQDLHADGVHFNAAGSALQAQQVAESVAAVLKGQAVAARAAGGSPE
ncbi:MAG TPA: SGNH/GDSL hydrolase family protein [Acidobacteriaceae bacterium]